ncbi:MAG: hypothetical protein CMN75_00150 [Spirochaeta sp.]|nr:hypothetical protein [Spirochaeta sp.]
MPAARVIAIVNQKGGVGKTTSAVSIAACLGVAEKKTLLIDLDPQGNASSGVGIVDAPRQIYDALVSEVALDSLVSRTEIEYLGVVPAGTDLVGAEVELVSREARESRLREAIAPIRDQYEFILIDCPPSLSLLTIMSLVASDELLVPLQTEFFALEGITQLVKTIDRIKENLNPTLSIRGILLTMFDKRNKLSSEVDKEARNYFKDKVYKTVIQRNVRLSEAPSHGLPCVIYDKSCVGSKSYFKLAEEFKNKIVSAA